MKKLQIQQKNNLTKISIDNAFLSALDKAELEEALSTFIGPPDVAAAAQKTYDYLQKKFGHLSKQELQSFWNSLLPSLTNFKNSSNLYSQILTKEAGITTYLTTKPSIVPENFYTNYTNGHLLTEDTKVSQGNYLGDILHLSNNVDNLRSYVRSPKDKNLYVSIAHSGKYSNFLTIKSNPLSEEGKKVRQFTQQHYTQIAQKAFEDAERIFKLPDELQILTKLKENYLNIPVFMDSATFGTLDTLNLGSLRQSYGSILKIAGFLLLNNNLLSTSALDSSSLFSINPLAASELKEKLEEIIAFQNPYLPSLLLLSSSQKYKSIEHTHQSNLRRFVQDFGNLMSSVIKLIFGSNPGSKPLGNLISSSIISNNGTEYDDLLIKLSSQFAISSEQNSGNDFFKIETAHSNEGYRIELNRTSLAYNPANEKAQASFNLQSGPKQTAILRNQTHNKIKLEARQRYGDSFSIDQYLEILVELTSGLAVANIQYTYDYLFEVLKLLWETNNKNPEFIFKDTLIIPLVPKIILDLNRHNISIYTHQIPSKIREANISPYYLYKQYKPEIMELFNTRSYQYDPSKSGEDNEAAFVASFMPASQLYEYAKQACLNMTNDRSTLESMKALLHQIVIALQSGFWSCPELEFKELAGVSDLLLVKKDLRLITDNFDFSISSFKEAQNQILSQGGTSASKSSAPSGPESIF